MLNGDLDYLETLIHLSSGLEIFRLLNMLKIKIHRNYTLETNIYVTYEISLNDRAYNYVSSIWFKHHLALVYALGDTSHSLCSAKTDLHGDNEY